MNKKVIGVVVAGVAAVGLVATAAYFIGSNSGIAVSVSTFDSSVSTLRASVHELEQRLASANATIEDNQSQIDALRESLAERNEAITVAVENVKSDTGATVDKLENLRSAVDTGNSRVTGDLRSLNLLVSQSGDRVVSALGTSLAGLKTDIGRDYADLTVKLDSLYNQSSAGLKNAVAEIKGMLDPAFAKVKTDADSRQNSIVLAFGQVEQAAAQRQSQLIGRMDSLDGQLSRMKSYLSDEFAATAELMNEAIANTDSILNTALPDAQNAIQTDIAGVSGLLGLTDDGADADTVFGRFAAVQEEFANTKAVVRNARRAILTAIGEAGTADTDTVFGRLHGLEDDAAALADQIAQAQAALSGQLTQAKTDIDAGIGGLDTGLAALTGRVGSGQTAGETLFGNVADVKSYMTQAFNHLNTYVGTAATDDNTSNLFGRIAGVSGALGNAQTALQTDIGALATTLGRAGVADSATIFGRIGTVEESLKQDISDLVDDISTVQGAVDTLGAPGSTDSDTVFGRIGKSTDAAAADTLFGRLGSLKAETAALAALTGTKNDDADKDTLFGRLAKFGDADDGGGPASTTVFGKLNLISGALGSDDELNKALSQGQTVLGLLRTQEYKTRVNAVLDYYIEGYRSLLNHDEALLSDIMSQYLQPVVNRRRAINAASSVSEINGLVYSMVQVDNLLNLSTRELHEWFGNTAGTGQLGVNHQAFCEYVGYDGSMTPDPAVYTDTGKLLGQLNVVYRDYKGTALF